MKRIDPHLALWGLIMMAWAGPVGATKPSLPAVGAIDVKLSAEAAQVTLRPEAELRHLSIQVYGTDGMKVGRDNLVLVQRARVPAALEIIVRVALAAGPGRTYLHVQARADGRQSMQAVQSGELSAEQRRKNDECVRKDPDGTAIRLMNCEEASPPLPVPTVPLLGTVTLTVAPAAPALSENATVRLDGGEVQLALTEPVYLRGPKGCAATTTLAAELTKPRPDDGSRRAEWSAHTDAACARPRRLAVQVERRR